MGVFYASRESVMDALDVKASAYSSSQIDRAIDGASRSVESLTNRIFYPLTATKSWAWPSDQDESSTLWLDANELVSLSSLTSGGVAVPSAGYYLEPQQYGPPYNRVEINRGSSYSFAGGSSGPQRSLNLTGVWCSCPLDERDEGTLTAGITASATSLVASRPVGVGRVLRIDSERLLVTEKSFVTSGQTGTLAAQLNANTLAVSDGTQFSVRESLLIDAERILVVDIAGNNLIVKRAQQGSTLAAHSGATIYWARSLTVTRGALGTVAATHATSAPVVRHIVPSLIEQLTIGYTLDQGLQESAGYARTVGQGDGERNAGGAGLRTLEARVLAAYGRQARTRAV